MSGWKSRAVPPGRGKVYSLTFLAGSRAFVLRLPRSFWIAGLVVLPLIGLVYLGATAYWIFHDDLLASLMRRQVDMQYAYEDRIGLLRHEIDAMTLRAHSEEARFSADLQNLTARQSQAENRTALLVALSERLKTYRLAEPRAEGGALAKSARPGRPNGAVAAELPDASRSYAPRAPQVPVRASNKPHPEMPDLRGDDTQSFNAESPAPAHNADARPSPVPAEDAAGLAAAYDRLDAEQVHVLANLLVPAYRFTKDVRTALAKAGLSADGMAASVPMRGAGTSARTDAKMTEGVGGPFVPLPVATDGSVFARQASILEAALKSSEGLRRILPYIPLRQPLAGPIEVTSGFGPRIDPFLGRAALHTGVDLLGAYGAPVRATAAGKVVFAGPNGGYGNMVEIDHGNGLTTRYAHLSAVLVELDQPVDAGAIVGRVGSTGRSTGAHLHYETRIGGEPVDPERLLRAGALLFGDADASSACRDPCARRMGWRD